MRIIVEASQYSTATATVLRAECWQTENSYEKFIFGFFFDKLLVYTYIHHQVNLRSFASHSAVNVYLIHMYLRNFIHFLLLQVMADG